MRNGRVDEAEAGNINNLRYADNTNLMAKSEEKLKSLLMRMKEKSEKADLKLNIKRKTHIKASVPITSWQIEWGKVEIVIDFIFLGSKITADGYCSPKRHLLLGRKTMTNLHSLLKKKRYHFTDKGPSSQSHGFSSSHIWM